MTEILACVAIGMTIACGVIGRHVRSSMVWFGWWAGVLTAVAVWSWRH